MKDSKRLLKTFTGHYHELQAAFWRTAAHKLPGAKGALREEAISRFISNWISKRYNVPTNVFATTKSGKEFSEELDLVIHDSNNGSLWKLDADGKNSLVTWEDIKLIVQIKSRLGKKEFNDACTSMQHIKDFSESVNTSPPPLLALFAYQMSSKGVLPIEEIICGGKNTEFPCDALIILDKGAYFADHLREISVGINKGLGPKQVQNDGPSQEKFIQEDCVEYAHSKGYRSADNSTPASILLSLAVLATYVTSGDDATQALLAASMHPEYSPIYNEKK